RSPRQGGGGRGATAAETAAGVHPQKDPRARLRDHRAQSRLFGGDRPRPRLPGSQKDSAAPGRIAPDGDPAMNRPGVCSDFELDIVASASGDGDPATDERVRHHLRLCAACADEYDRYRAIGGTVEAIRRAPVTVASIERARKRLEASLNDLRRRTVA